MLLRRTPARVEREKEEARVDGVVTPDRLEKLVSKHDKTIGEDGEEEFGGQPGALAIMARRRRPSTFCPHFPFRRATSRLRNLIPHRHYMADILQALCWGLICGFEVLLPYWYVCFFVPMIIHRAVRDDARCAEKYGADWDTYIRRVPYVFVPGLV